jgi:hypothetical protein
MPDGRGAPSNTTPTDQPRDFGVEVYRLIKREAAIHPTQSQQRVSGVEQLNEKWNVPQTINAIVPADQLGALEQWMRKLLGFYDDGTLSGLTQRGALVLKEAADTPALLRALTLAAQREGMIPALRQGEGGFLLRILDFPKQRDLLQQVANWWLKHDGFSDDGTLNAPSENAVLAAFFRAAAKKLGDLVPSERKESPSFLYDALLLEDTRLDLKVGKRCAVLVDSQGTPTLTAAGKAYQQTGQPLPPPFPAPPFRVGNCGEALDTNGKRIYDTRTLDQTVMGSLLRVGRELIVRDLPLKSGQLPFPFNVPVGLRPLLGPIAPTGSYAKDSPILQALTASLTLLKGPKLYDLVAWLGRITEKEEAQLAATLSLFKQLESIANKHKASINGNNKLLEELLPFMQELVATPGMLKDLLTAMQTPGLADKLKQGTLLLLKYKKSKITADEYQRFKQGQKDAIFGTRVDHGLPDRKGNLSLFQRLVHMMHDFNRLPYKSKIKALGGIDIPFIEMRVDNLALMYLKAVIGKLSIWEAIYVNGKPIEDGILKTQLTNSLPDLGLSEKPTPEELAVFVNRDLTFKQVPLLGTIKVDLTLDPIRCKEGYTVREHHSDVLLAGLASGLVGNDGGALKPIAQVFDKYNKLPRMLDLIAVLHKHWGTAANDETTKAGVPTYKQPTTNIRTAEPIVIDALEQTDILTRLDAFSGILLTTKLSDAADAPLGLPTLQRYLSFALGAPDVPLAKTPIGPLVDALKTMYDTLQLPEHAKARTAWESGMDALVDLLLQVEGTGAQARFKNRRAPIVLTRLLSFASERIKQKDLAGQWAPELSRLQTTVEDLLTDPIVPSTLDLLDSLVNDRVLLDLTTQLLVHALPNHEQKPAQFGEFLLLANALLAPGPEDIAIPIARFAGTFLQKYQPLMTQTAYFLKRAIPTDTNDLFTALIRRSIVTHANQNTMRVALFPALMTTMYRHQPGQTTSPEAKDFQKIFQSLATYLTDNERGLEKLYDVIRKRNGPTNN